MSVKETDVEKHERLRDAVEKELETMRKQLQQTVEAVATIGQAVAQMREEQGKGQAEQGKKLDIVSLLGAFLLKDLQGDKSPVDNFTRNIENMARVAQAIDAIRSPPDHTGELAKLVLMKAGTKAVTHAGVPRYMTKEEMKRYDALLDEAFGLGKEEEETKEGHLHG